MLRHFCKYLMINFRIDETNDELANFVSIVKKLLVVSMRFGVKSNENVVYISYYDNHIVKLIFETTQIIMVYELRKVIIPLRNPLKLLTDNFSNYIDHFILMIITGLYFEIRVKTFDRFTIFPMGICLHKAVDDKKNYSVEFKRLSNNKKTIICGIDNCLREINSYKLMLQ